MAPLASASLVAAITANQTIINVGAITTPSGSAGFPAVGTFPLIQQPYQIDSELMYIVNQPIAGTIVVRNRGSEGTLATAHDALTVTYTGFANDFGPNPPAISGFIDITNAYALNIGSAVYTVVLPSSDTIYNINCGSAAAITLPLPLGSQNGLMLHFTAGSTAAHVITCTNGLQSGVGAQPKSTITFGGVLGSGVELIAENGLWATPVTPTGVTIA